MTTHHLVLNQGLSQILNQSLHAGLSRQQGHVISCSCPCHAESKAHLAGAMILLELPH